MSRKIRLTEAQLTKAIQNLVEQNRRLLDRREIKIVNKDGQSELFDVSEVYSTRSGCKFFGKFRGEYDKVNDFFRDDTRFSEIVFGGRLSENLFEFEFKCDRPDESFILTSYNENTQQKYTLTPDAAKTLSGVCRCKRYGAPVDVKPKTTTPPPLNPNSDATIYAENKKPIKLTEADLVNLVKRVMEEGDRFAYGTDAIRNLEKDMAPDEDVRLTDYTGELRGDVLKKKDYIIQWLRDIIHNEDWNRLGDVILYMKHRM